MGLYSPRPLPALYELYSSDSQPHGGNVRRMRRARYDPYARSTQAAYIVVRDMQHQMIEVPRLEPAVDLPAAMVTAIKRLEAQGWLPEGSANHGFVFVRRAGERRNVAPTQMVPVIRAVDGDRRFDKLRWVLIPFFAKGEPPKYSTINAPIETVETESNTIPASWSPTR
jgi:SOS response associated peptidase (SRAP)